jgi:diguanylate cyclase (GGDEF)-like protein
VILPETGKVQARAFAERVIRAIYELTVVIAMGDGTKSAIEVAETANQGGIPLIVPVPTISVGLASFPEDGRNPETLMARADAALYRAKRAGRNSISI